MNRPGSVAARPGVRGGVRGGGSSWLVRRLLLGVAQTAAVVVLVFVLTEALPGDAAVVRAGDQPDPGTVAAVRARMGLDRPAHERFTEWATGVFRGDLGISSVTGRPVTAYLAGGAGPTLLLAAVTVALLIPSALALGVLTARQEGGFTDRLVTTLTLGLYAVPEFALGLLLVAVFALRLGWFPPTALGSDGDLLARPAVLVLPVLVLLARPVCSLSRLVRAGTLDALAAPYAVHARRYGIGGPRLLLGHVLPNALTPAAQQLARTVDWLVSGVIVVEALFAIPGLGSVLMDAVAARDLPVVQGLAVVFALTTVVLNLAADLVTGRLAPRAESVA